MSHDADSRSGAQKVFLSYSRADSAFLDRLQAGLAARGYEPIYDRSERPSDDPDLTLSAQDEWWRQLQTMIAACDVMVFVVTPASAASRVCDDEIACAKNFGKRVIAILRQDTAFDAAPERLRALNVKLDFCADEEPAFAAALDALARELDQDLDWRRRGAHFARLAQKWETERRPDAQLLRAGAIADAESWAARRPDAEPAPGPILLAFLDDSRAKEKKDADARRRLIQRGFASPARAALAEGRGDAALRRVAAGALMSEDLEFALDAETEEPHRFGLWRSALRAVQGNPIAVLRGHAGQVHQAAFSPDARRILTCMVGEMRLWDAATGAELCALPGAWGGIFSTDGACFLLWHTKRLARLLDAATGEEIAALRVDGDFTHVCFSPDGARILTADSPTASAAQAVQLWDGATGASIAALRGHERRISQVAFSPDGKRVLTASVDGTARLWDAAAGGEIAVLRGHATEPHPHYSDGISRGWIQTIAFSPDGARALTGSNDTTVRIWDAGSGAEIAVLRGHDAEIASAAFSADGKRVLTTSPDLSVRLWNAATGAQIAVLVRSRGHLHDVAFSPDGARAAISDTDGRQHAVRLFDGETGGEIAIVRQSGAPIEMLCAFSPDGGRMLLTLSEDQDKGAAYLFDGVTGAEIAPLRGHKDKINVARFSPDGRSIVTASDDTTARLWDAGAGASIASLGGHEDKVRCVAFSADGRGILTGGDDCSARLWRAASSEIATLRGAGFAFSPDGARILTGYGPTQYAPQPQDRCARLWDAATGAEIAVLRAHDMSWVDHVAISSDGARALTASREGVVRLWETTSWKEVAALRGPQLTTASPVAAFSDDGARVIMALGSTVKVCNAASGAEIGALRCGDSNLNGMALGRDASRILTRHFDMNARLWDVANGAEIALPRKCVALSPDGARVLTVGSANDPARLWDVATGAEVAALQGQVGSFESVAFSPDGARVLAGASDFTARLWDAVTGGEIAALHGHRNRVLCVAFSPEGARVLTGSADQTARLWDAVTGAELAVLSVLEGEPKFELAEFTGEIRRVGFSPDGTMALTGGADGMSRLWDIAWSKALTGDRIVFLAAALDCGLGRCSAKETADLLMQDAPHDLFAALMERMTPEQKLKVAEASRILRAARHPLCYRTPGRRIGYWDR